VRPVPAGLTIWPEAAEEKTLVQALGDTAAARLTAKLRRCEESVQTFIGNPRPELSNPPAGAMPAFGVYTRRRVAEGKMQEYQELMKAEILPIYKRAKRTLDGHPSRPRRQRKRLDDDGGFGCWTSDGANAPRSGICQVSS
jgi:hypothetical protein